MNIKEKSSTISVEQHVLEVSSTDPHLKVDASTELHWQWAMMRRGIAFDQCGLIKWDTHQKWAQQLLALVSRDAPSGYNRVTLEQLGRADCELFTIMSQELQLANTKLTDVPPPMDVQLDAFRTDPRIQLHLLPMMKGRISGEKAYP